LAKGRASFAPAGSGRLGLRRDGMSHSLPLPTERCREKLAELRASIASQFSL
jgi:hypothetical protein